MTIDEIREWYEANKIHTLYQGHWCRTCSIGFLLHQIDARDGRETDATCAHDLQKMVLDWYFGSPGGPQFFFGEPVPEYPPPPSKPFSMETVLAGYGNAFSKGGDECGRPGHFIASDKCLFRLHTHVGAGAVRYCVSTVGDFYIGEKVSPMGFNRMFETMVFCLDASGKHDGKNVDFCGYMRASSASDGHVELCEKWRLRAVASNHDDGDE